MWTPRKAEPVNRRVPDGLDFLGFSRELESAAFATSALAFSTAAICRHGPIMEAMDAMGCDCLADIGSSCYKSSEQLLLVDRVCPFATFNVTGRAVKLIIPDDAVPPKNGCQTIFFYLSPASHFESTAGAKLSSEVFLEARPNSLSVVTNERGSFVGQLISDGIVVSWNDTVKMQTNLTLCITPSDVLLATVVDKYSVYGLAYQCACPW